MQNNINQRTNHSVHWSLYSNIRHIIQEARSGASGKGTAGLCRSLLILHHRQEHPELEGRRRRNANRRGPGDHRAGDLGSNRPTRAASAVHRPERERAPGPSHLEADRAAECGAVMHPRECRVRRPMKHGTLPAKINPS